MKLGRIRFVSPLLVLSVATLAGCGSSSKSTSAPAAAASSTSATSTSASGVSSGATSVALTTKHNDKLGTILAAGNKKRTVYFVRGGQGVRVGVLRRLRCGVASGRRQGRRIGQC
jgi:hypothetical protein